MKNKLLSIIIPVYNEAPTVETLLEKVLAAPLSIDKELILVNDGSTDGSGEILQAWAARHRNDARVTVLSQKNGGKGSAVRTGIQNSHGDIVIVQDADLEYNPCDHERCVAPILSGEAHVVYGSRERYNKNRANSSWAFYLGGLSVTLFFNFAFGSMLTDEPCCYKTFEGDLIRNLPFSHDGFGWEPEVTGKLLKIGIRIHEVPVEYHPRKVDENKKIKWTDGLAAFFIGGWERLRLVGSLRKRLYPLSGVGEEMKQEQRFCNAILLLFAAALLLRLALAIPALLTPESLLRPDSFGYLQFSCARPPLYPALLQLLAPLGTAAIGVAGCLFSALTVWPIAMAGRLLHSRRAGVIAALLWGLNLTGIANAPLILADTFFAFLVGWQCFFAVRLWKYHRLFDFGFAAGFAFLACLVKPANLPVALFGIPFLGLLFLRPAWKLASGWLGCLILALVLLLPVCFWNQSQGGDFMLDSNTGITALHNASAIVAHAEKRDPRETLAELFQQAEQRAAAEQKTLSEAQKELYEETIRRYPQSFLLTHLPQQTVVLYPDLPSALENWKLTSSGQGTLAVIRKDDVAAGLRHYLGGRSLCWILPFLPLMLAMALTYLGAAGEVWKRLCCREWLLLLVFCTVSLSSWCMPDPVIMPRYVLPMTVLLCVLAGCFLARRFFQQKQQIGCVSQKAG